MEYRKETHFIVAYEEEKMRGKWDIITNQYIGVKGKTIKSKPVAFNTKQSYDLMNPIIASAYRFVSDFFDNKYHSYTEVIGKRIEEIISVGLRVEYSWDTYFNLTECLDVKLNKECVNFLIENYNGIYSDLSIKNYRIYKDYKNLLDKCGERKAWATDILNRINKTIPSDFVANMILRGIHEKVFATHDSRNYAYIINHWYEMIVLLKDTLEAKHNILTNYTILQWTYEEYKTAHYDEMIKKHNDKSWLYFEDDNYIVRPLLTRAEFHDEAEQQHNCVERLYMEAVAKGKTYIVTVRLKNNPNASYITCEVTNDGYINQYRYRFNNPVTIPLDLKFEEKYQNHIKENMEK